MGGTLDLFDSGTSNHSTSSEPREEVLAEGAVLLGAFARGEADQLLRCIEVVASASPFRTMSTPSGHRMSVAMTNCGRAGWVSDRAGYRYSEIDPETGRVWPTMPAVFRALAERAAAKAGYASFEPDACLVNRYEPGARITLHQDRNERDFSAPIVSVSLGLPAVFLFGGAQRTDPTRRVRLEHGDVAVWGGPARLAFHAVAPLADGDHLATGALRYNLTFRRAF